MTGVVVCNNKKCACNAEGDCEYAFGIELNDDGKCISFIEMEQEKNDDNEGIS